MLNEKVYRIFILLAVWKLRFVFSQCDGYNLPPCYYSSYAHTGYIPYPYSYPDEYDCTAYGYPYGAYMNSGYYGNYDHGDIYSSPCDAKQPIIIVVENKDKHDDLTIDDLISLSLGLVKKLPENTNSCASTRYNCDCCESKHNGRFEFYSECNCSCNGCSSCNKKCGNKKSSCKGECGYCNSDCCRDNCRHIVICEYY